jgi:hypothetical protein
MRKIVMTLQSDDAYPLYWRAMDWAFREIYVELCKP